MTPVSEQSQDWIERAAARLAEAGYRAGGAVEHEIVLHGTCRACAD